MSLNATLSLLTTFTPTAKHAARVRRRRKVCSASFSAELPVSSPRKLLIFSLYIKYFPDQSTPTHILFNFEKGSTKGVLRRCLFVWGRTASHRTSKHSDRMYTGLMFEALAVSGLKENGRKRMFFLDICFLDQVNKKIGKINDVKPPECLPVSGSV